MVCSRRAARQTSRRRLSGSPPFENREGWGSLSLGLCKGRASPPTTIEAVKCRYNIRVRHLTIHDCYPHRTSANCFG
jgi:hypothetical protein